MPPHPDAIVAAEKTGHKRFLELCDPDHADYNPAYLAVVAGIAGTAPPSLLTKAASLAAAVVTHAAAGFPAADEATAAARLAVCHTCEEFRPPNSCAVCGCNLTAKSRWQDQACPEGRWPQ